MAYNLHILFGSLSFPWTHLSACSFSSVQLYYVCSFIPRMVSPVALLQPHPPLSWCHSLSPHSGPPATIICFSIRYFIISRLLCDRVIQLSSAFSSEYFQKYSYYVWIRLLTLSSQMPRAWIASPARWGWSCLPRKVVPCSIWKVSIVSRYHLRTISRYLCSGPRSLTFL